MRVTLRQLGIAPSTLYGWYQRFLDGGIEALHDKKPKRRPRWNKIPEPVRTEQDQEAHDGETKESLPRPVRGLTENHEPSLAQHGLLSEIF